MDSNNGKDFAQLLAAVRAGSSEALGQLLQAYGSPLRRIARHGLSPRLRRKCGESDLVQDTFVKAHRHFADFRGSSPEEFCAWLARILGHNLNDLRRHYASASRQLTRETTAGDGGLPTGLVDRAVTPFDSTQRRESDADYTRALADLPDMWRQIVGLHLRDGLPFDEIARRLGLPSAGAACKYHARAIAQVREKVRGRPERSVAGASVLCASESREVPNTV
jgi:RNA polymerase sigma-70 factor (ECF subfamily)